MNQLRALIWLKWKLFRNALRSRKSVASQAASVLVTLAAIALALVIAFGIGALGGAVANTDMLSPGVKIFNFFVIVACLYMIWAVLPVSMGSGREFEPERLLLYPVSLRKLFAMDYVSDLASLASIFAIPAIIFLSLGAGIGSGNVLLSLPVALLSLACGLAISKFVTTSLGLLVKRKRTRGESLVALIGMILGLSGVFVGQLVPYLTSNNTINFSGLRWTPPGATAVALIRGLSAGGERDYALALLTLAGYTCLLVLVTYRIARRAALGIGGASRATVKVRRGEVDAQYAGWHLPLLSAQLSAVVEKELRYAMRNAQLRMLALMPLLLIGIRLLPSSGRSGSGILPPDMETSFSKFFFYSEGLYAAGGIFYIFLVLSSVACNIFAFDGSGMRALILAPARRSTILLGKNLVLAFIASTFALLLLLINQLVFRDLTLRALVFALLCVPIFAAIMMLGGNWLSLHYPKHLKFGKRMNVSGMTSLLILPLTILMALPPFAAIFAGYLAQSLAVKYVTLTLFAVMSVALYYFLINRQGQALAGREQEILEVISERTDGV